MDIQRLSGQHLLFPVMVKSATAVFTFFGVVERTSWRVFRGLQRTPGMGEPPVSHEPFGHKKASVGISTCFSLLLTSSQFISDVERSRGSLLLFVGEQIV